MLEEQKTQGSTERSEERSRQKLARVLERTISLDSVPVSAIYNNIVLDLVQYLDRPGELADQSSVVMPNDTTEWVSGAPPAVDEMGVDLLSPIGVRSSG